MAATVKHVYGPMGLGALFPPDERDDAAHMLAVPTLEALVRCHVKGIAEVDVPAACELVLEGLHQASLLAKDRSPDCVTYGDMLKRMFAGFEE